MKRIWFSVLFIILALSVCTFEQITVKNGYENITKAIDNALECEDETEKAEYCKEITTEWNKYYKKITLVTDHSIIQSADVSINTLKNISNYDAEGSDDTLIEAKSELKQIYESSRITFSNIF